MEKREVIIDGKTISLLVNNNFDINNPTIFLHGWGENKYSFIRSLEFYENKNLSYISVDLPGFGESDKADKNWGYKEYSIVIEKIISLFKINNINIVGHGLGGEIGMYITGKSEIKINKLVIIAAGKYNSKFIKFRNILTCSIYKFINNLELIAKFKKSINTNIYKKSSLIETLKNDFENFDVDIGYKIKAMTLILWGNKDLQNNLSNGIFMNKIIKNSKLIILDGGNHFVHIHKSHTVNGHIVNFIYEM